MNFTSFYLNNFSSPKRYNGELPSGSFNLSTCQRDLIISSEPLEELDACIKLSGEQAYTYLLEVVCGLQSKLLGEHEIVSQLKQAHHGYLQNTTRCPKIIHVIEKLLKDSKEIRSNYLLGLGQKTYASISRKLILKQKSTDHVIILGSGAMAEDLINQFKKKVRVSICARNSSRVKELCESHEIDNVDWTNIQNLTKMPYIVNTIGTQNVILEEGFFCDWKSLNPNGIFIDLGSPSCIKSQLDSAQGFYGLDDIFQAGAIHEELKLKKINAAKQAISNLAEKRIKHLTEKIRRDEKYRKC